MAFVDESILPTHEEVEFYREHGWFISKTILSDALIDRALEGCWRLYAGERDHTLDPISHHLDWTPEQGDVLRLNAYVSLQIQEFYNLVHTPIIGAIAARLAGTNCIRLFRDQLIYKPPNRGTKNVRVGWHTDRAYWHTCSSNNMLTAWIPLHDCDERRGTLVMLDGSHRWPDYLDRSFGDQDLDSLLAKMDTGGNQIVEVPMNLRKGQISFHHCRTIHGSRDNLASTPRISLAIHLQDAQNQYRVHLNEQGRPTVHLNDLLCRKHSSGLPDYSDPEFFPVLWPVHG